MSTGGMYMTWSCIGSSSKFSSYFDGALFRDNEIIDFYPFAVFDREDSLIFCQLQYLSYTGVFMEEHLFPTGIITDIYRDLYNGFVSDGLGGNHLSFQALLLQKRFTIVRKVLLDQLDLFVYLDIQRRLLFLVLIREQIYGSFCYNSSFLIWREFCIVGIIRFLMLL